MNGVDLPAPHGFLVWKRTQSALPSVQELPVGEKVVVLSNGEAYGEVVLDDPSYLLPHEFDREEYANAHRTRPQEREKWWPGVKRFYVYPIREWDQYPRMVPASMEGGQVVFKDAPPPTGEEKALLDECRKLPKQIVVQEAAAILGDQGIESPYDLKGLKAPRAEAGKAVPLYDLVLVRRPVLQIEEKKTALIETSWEGAKGESCDLPDWRGEGGDHAVQEEAEKEEVASEDAVEEVKEMPKPRKGENEKEFIARCIPTVMEDGSAKHNKQAVAMCYSMWEDAQNEAEKALTSTPQPEPGEGRGDFILRCIPAIGQQGLDAERSKRICYGVWDRWVSENPEDREGENEGEIRIPEDDQQPDNQLPDDGGKPGGGDEGDDDQRAGEGQNAAEAGEASKAGKRLRRSIKEKLQDAINALKEIAQWGDYEDKEEAVFMDLFKSQDAGCAVKTVNGEPWLVMWSTNAFEDRQNEKFSTASLEHYVAEAEKADDRGTFDFWHIPGSDIADKKWQGVVGRFLVEAGPFQDTPVGKRAKAFFLKHPRSHPTIAPEGWGASPQFRYLPEDRKGGTYNWIWVMKTSILPRAAAANVWTKGEVSMAKLSDEQRKAAAEIFGADFVKSLEEEGERKTKELEEAGVAFKGKDKWAKAKAALKELADEAEGETLAKALKEMADELDDESALKNAKSLRATAKKMGGDMAGKLRQIAAMLTGDEEEEEPVEEEEPTAKKSEEVADLLVQLTAALKAQTDPIAEALNTLAGRVDAIEARKAADVPRRVQRASEAEETEVAEDDPLLKMKPRETERREGTLANSFFPVKK